MARSENNDGSRAPPLAVVLFMILMFFYMFGG